MPRVLNKYRDEIPEGAVYIGRPSKWGNPFVLRNPNNREQVIRLYKHWMMKRMEEDSSLLEEIKTELGGKDLVCFCAPHACHGDVLIKLANGEDINER